MKFITLPALNAQQVVKCEASLTEDQTIEPFHVFMTFLKLLPTSSLHIEMVWYMTGSPGDVSEEPVT